MIFSIERTEHYVDHNEKGAQLGAKKSLGLHVLNLALPKSPTLFGIVIFGDDGRDFLKSWENGDSESAGSSRWMLCF